MKSILLILSFGISSAIQSQVEILNNALLDSSAPIAYRDYVNKIVVSSYERDSTVMVIAHGDTLHRQGDYFYYSCSKAKTDTLIALKGSCVIAQKIYHIEALKNPQIFLGSLRDSFVTKDQLLANPGLIVSYEPQIARPCTRVVDFTGEIIKRNGRHIPLEDKKSKRYQNWSNEKWERKLLNFEKRGGTIYNGMNVFKSMQVKLIERMKKGDILQYHMVTLSCSSCVKRKMTVNLRFILI